MVRYTSERGSSSLALSEGAMQERFETKGRTATMKQTVVARESVAKFDGVLYTIPKIDGLTYEPATDELAEHYNSALTLAVDSGRTERINRLFVGIKPKRDCGRAKVFRLEVQRWVLTNGAWYVHLVFKPSKLKRPKNVLRVVVRTKESVASGDINLSHNGTSSLRVEQVNPRDYEITCGECTKKVYTTHGFNDKFARTNDEAQKTGKPRWLCPDCLPRTPRARAEKPEELKPASEAQIAHFRRMAGNKFRQR